MKDLSSVIESGMCVACGACTAVNPEITLVLDEDKLLYRPSSPGSEQAAAICPAIATDFDALHEFRFPNAEQSEHGVVRSVHLGQSTNADRNLKASSGGLIKELLIELLESSTVDSVIALNHVEGLRYEPELLQNAADVDDLPGSVYHSISFEKVFSLLEQSEGRVALVAIPCQLEGIFSYIRAYRPELNDKISITIGLVCGWTYTHHSLRALSTYKGIEANSIEHISYRGDGPVGKMRVQTDRRVVSIDRRSDIHYIAAFDRSFNLPRCHACTNHVNFLADIVVGDAWLDRAKPTRTGISLIICRSEVGEEVLRSAQSNARITTLPTSVDDIVESQSANLVFGHFAYSWAQYLRETGRHAPSLLGPNLGMAKPIDRSQLVAFDSDISGKVALQRKGRYREMLWRKIGFDMFRYGLRFVRKRLRRSRSSQTVREIVPNPFR